MRAKIFFGMLHSFVHKHQERIHSFYECLSRERIHSLYECLSRKGHAMVSCALVRAHPTHKAKQSCQPAGTSVAASTLLTCMQDTEACTFKNGPSLPVDLHLYIYLAIFLSIYLTHVCGIYRLLQLALMVLARYSAWVHGWSEYLGRSTVDKVHACPQTHSSREKALNHAIH